MKSVLLKNVKKGQFFTLNPVEFPNESQVYVRGDYCRLDKKFEVSKFSDINFSRFLRGDRFVYIDFIF